MGWFDSISRYRGQKRERQSEKNLKYLKNPKAIKEDRQGAIEYFASLDDTEVAVPALLQRFEYSLEHGINDSREKEKCLDGIIRHGEKAIPFITTHLQVTNRIAWPIKALAKVSQESQLVDSLKSCLNFGDISFDQAKIDKNFDILCYLRDFQLPGLLDKIAGFLQVPDERLRFAGCEVILEQDDPKVPSMIEPFLADSSSENTRLRQLAVEAFVTKGWPLSKPEQFPNGIVMNRIRVAASGRLERY